MMVTVSLILSLLHILEMHCYVHTDILKNLEAKKGFSENTEEIPKNGKIIINNIFVPDDFKQDVHSLEKSQNNKIEGINKKTMDALTGNVKFDKHMKINLSGNADNKSGWRTIQDDNQLNGVGSKKDNIDLEAKLPFHWADVFSHWKENDSTAMNLTNRNNDFSFTKEFEERIYPDTLFLCSKEEINEEKSANIEKSFDEMFVNLFSQIKRKNLSMTLPVFMYLHLTSTLVVDKTAMCFWITQEKTKTKDKLFDDLNLKLFWWEMKQTVFYVLRFSGPGKKLQKEEWSKQTQILLRMIEAEGLENQIRKHQLVLASYDEPWKTEGRRDEILVQKLNGGDQSSVWSN